MNVPISALLQRKGPAVHSIAPHLSIFEAVAEMNRLRIGAIVILAIESTNPNRPPPPPPPSSPDGGRGCPSACARLGRLTTAVLDSVYKAFVHFLWNSPMHEVPIRRRRRAMTR